MPTGDPCYFCEIANGNAHQWQIVEKSDLTITVLNARQYEIGQCIVFPRRHAPTLLDLKSSEESAVMAAAKRTAAAFVDAYSPDGVLLYQNNGTGSGQEVPHFHLHVVPRQPNSDWGVGPPPLARFEAEGRPPKFDYSLPTDAKTATVEELRERLK